MRSILCRLLLVPAIAAAASLSTQSAKAETITVPFSFTANGDTFPAGAYTVQEDMQASVVTLHEVNGTKAIKFAVGPGDPSPTDNRVVLRFETKGDEHVLESVQYASKITARLDGAKPSSQERASHDKPTKKSHGL